MLLTPSAQRASCVRASVSFPPVLYLQMGDLIRDVSRSPAEAQRTPQIRVEAVVK